MRLCEACAKPLGPYRGRGRPPLYHPDCNKAEIAARNRAYYEANKAELAAKKRAYREANKAELAAKQRAYREANKAEIAARVLEREARRPGPGR